jgi:hypothetical protein
LALPAPLLWKSHFGALERNAVLHYSIGSSSAGKSVESNEAEHNFFCGKCFALEQGGFGDFKGM